jgi:hypothetical protein
MIQMDETSKGLYRVGKARRRIFMNFFHACARTRFCFAFTSHQGRAPCTCGKCDRTGPKNLRGLKNFLSQ